MPFELSHSRVEVPGVWAWGERREAEGGVSKRSGLSAGEIGVGSAGDFGGGSAGDFGGRTGLGGERSISSIGASEMGFRRGEGRAMERSSVPVIQNSEPFFLMEEAVLNPNLLLLKMSPLGGAETVDRRAAGLSFGGWRGSASNSGGMEDDREDLARVRGWATSSLDVLRAGPGLSVDSFFKFLVFGLC